MLGTFVFLALIVFTALLGDTSGSIVLEKPELVGIAEICVCVQSKYRSGLAEHWVVGDKVYHVSMGENWTPMADLVRLVMKSDRAINNMITKFSSVIVDTLIAGRTSWRIVALLEAQVMMHAKQWNSLITSCAPPNEQFERQMALWHFAFISFHSGPHGENWHTFRDVLQHV